MFNWSIYRITNPEGYVYIGRTNNLGRRKSYYKSIYNKKYAGKSLINNSLNKYGFESHVFEVIDEIFGTNKDIGSKEMFWIRTYMSNRNKWRDMNGLNLTDGGSGGMAGYKAPQEYKDRLKGRVSNMKGKKHSPETIALLKIKLKGKRGNRLGQKHTGTIEERKEKWGKMNIGNQYTKGYKKTAEQINNHRMSIMGKENKKLWIPIIQYDLNNNIINEFSSIKEAIKSTGLNKSTVHRNLNGTIKEPTKWRFKYKLI